MSLRRVRETLVHAVGDGAVVVQRCENALHGVQDVLDAADVQVGFLLPRERRIGKVLGRGRGAHGEARLGHAMGDARVFLADLLFQLGRDRARLHLAPNLRARLGQRMHVVHIYGFEGRLDRFGELVVGEELVEGFGGSGEAAGNAHAACGQLADQLSQRGVLAAHLRDIGIADGFEGQDEAIRHGVVGLESAGTANL
jgi:hypothetical protein